MITDPTKLRELVEELAELSLEARRKYLADVESASGKEASDQLKRALSEHWAERKR